MKRAPRSRQRHDLYAKYHDYDSEISDLLGECGFNRLWHQIDVHSDVLEVVGELRAAGIYCAVASNQQARRAKAMSIGLSYREKFDAEYYSCDLGLKKPMEAYFHRIIERCGFEPSRVLFVDDRMSNLEAARAIGIHALRFVADEHLEKGKALKGLIGNFEESPSRYAWGAS